MAEYTAYDDLPVRRFEAFPRAALLLVGVLLVLGLAAFVAALLLDPARAWRAYLQNWLFFASISAGATMLAAIVTMARGLWSQPIRRIALSYASFLPVAWLLLIPLVLVGAPSILPWLHGGLPAGKRVWLNLPFLTVRNLVLFGGFVGVSLGFAYWSLRPDLGTIQAEGGASVPPVWQRLTRGWRGPAEEAERASHATAVLAPIMALLYALSLSIVAFDFVMSLEPEFKSTLLGGYFFMGAILGGVAATALLTTIYRRALGLEDVILPGNYHDLGKLHFAFNIFWAYLFWAQFIVIWYGLLPHEQIFPIHRFANPIGTVALIVLFCLFVVPFFGLLGVRPKRTPGILAIFNVIVLGGLWLERWLLTYPSWYPGPGVALGWQEVGIGLGFAGLMVATLLWFSSRFPVVQLWRPQAELELLGRAEGAPGGEIVRPH